VDLFTVVISHEQDLHVLKQLKPNSVGVLVALWGVTGERSEVHSNQDLKKWKQACLCNKFFDAKGCPRISPVETVNLLHLN
jgi:hypothetical protein